MDKIEIGEYVKTKDGLIGKLEQINKEPTNESITYIITDTFEGLLEEIAEHNKDITMLIDAGDYVNGKKIKMNYETGKLQIPNRIKSIVTKEQFADMEYKVGV